MLNFKDAFAQTGGENFPSTTSKNSSGGDALDGTHINKDFIDDWWGFAQACLSAASVTPNGVNETYNNSQILASIVVKVLADASSNDIDNDTGIAGATVSDALNSLSAIISALNSNDIGNNSGVAGINVSAALDTISALISGLSSNDISDESSLATASVSSAIDALNAARIALTAGDISNNSSVSGANVDDALNNLNGNVTSLQSDVSSLETTSLKKLDSTNVASGSGSITEYVFNGYTPPVGKTMPDMCIIRVNQEAGNILKDRTLAEFVRLENGGADLRIGLGNTFLGPYDLEFDFYYI